MSKDAVPRPAMSGEFTTGPSAPFPPRARQHSVRMVAAVHSWASSIRAETADEAKSVYATWCELMRALAGEGSFLGFPRISKICRVLHAGLESQIACKQPLNQEQCEIVANVAQALAELVTNPRSESISVAALVQQLRLAFDLSEAAMSKAIAHVNYLPDDELTRERPQVSHRDMDVYLSARLDSLDRCVEEESWIVNQLASLAEDLACGMQSQRPAHRLMTVLRSHKFFHQVDRVCLAGRVPNSNQLMVVDSASSDRCEVNVLKPGYSCFVNPEGSLFNMRPGTMRIFDDSQRVLDSFAASGKPAQRSIALINDMGLRSGLCLAIGRESDLQGFLFLNSCQPELFRDITIRFAPLISLLGLVATIALDSNGFHKAHSQHGLMDTDLPKSSLLFDAGEFQGFLYRALQRRLGSAISFHISSEMDETIDDFLYLPAQACGILAELIMRLHLIDQNHNSIVVRIGIDGAMATFGLRCQDHLRSSSHLEWMSDHVACVSRGLGNTPVKLSIRQDEVQLQIPFEPVLQSHRGLRYSVVF